MTFRRVLSGRMNLFYGHGLNGLRFRFLSDVVDAAMSIPTENVVGEPPPDVTTFNLSGACWFCSAVRSRVPDLGIGTRSGAIICYECVAMGYDAFRYDGADVRRGERPPRRSPVRWVRSAPPRSTRWRPQDVRRLGVL